MSRSPSRIVPMVSLLLIALLLAFGEYDASTASVPVARSVAYEGIDPWITDSPADEFLSPDIPEDPYDQNPAFSAVLAWGDNGSGQLGNGLARTAFPLPVPVPGIPRVKAIAAGPGFSATTGVGGGHSLALLPDGTIRAWGANRFGQLGDGTTQDHISPVVVRDWLGNPFDQVKSISAGYSTSMALRADGTVWVWGMDMTRGGHPFSEGKTSLPHPVQVEDLPKIKMIASGHFHMAVLSETGRVFAWGWSDGGALAQPPPWQSYSAVRIENIPPFIAIACGLQFTMGLDVNGIIWTWGYDNWGQLGRRGIGNDRNGWNSTPGVVVLQNVKAIAAGGYHAAALSANGGVWTWGRGDQGQLGTGADDRYPTNWPTPYRDGGRAKALAAGIESTFVLHADGTIWSAGRRNAIGRDGPQGMPAPVQTIDHGIRVAIRKITGITAGGDHALAMRSYQTAWGWGNNDRGQLGIAGYRPDRSAEPIEVPDIGDAIQVATGKAHTVLLDSAGHVWTWGDNSHGQLGIGKPKVYGTDRPIPIEVPEFEDIIAVSAGEYHSLALRADGTVWAWGDNSKIQLSAGVAGGVGWIPQRIATYGYLKSVSAGGEFSMALQGDGILVAWGPNDHGQVSPRHGPLPIGYPAIAGDSLDSRFCSVAGGSSHVLALGADGEIKAWGSNSDKQVGDVRGLKAVHISAGGSHSLALRADGTVFVWGSNWDGQLALHWTVPSVGLFTPNGSRGVIDLAGGRNHSVELRSDGTVWTYGSNMSGQLGTGDFASRWVATPALGPDQVTSISTRDRHTLCLR